MSRAKRAKRNPHDRSRSPHAAKSRRARRPARESLTARSRARARARMNFPRPATPTRATRARVSRGARATSRKRVARSRARGALALDARRRAVTLGVDPADRAVARARSRRARRFFITLAAPSLRRARASARDKDATRTRIRETLRRVTTDGRDAKRPTWARHEESSAASRARSTHGRLGGVNAAADLVFKRALRPYRE